MLAPRSGPWIAAPLAGAAAWIALWLLLPLPSGPAPIAPMVALATVSLVLLVFFRDPNRAVGLGVVSPADGRVTALAQREGRWEVSIFMNLHDVHVNRMPLAGKVEAITHHPGSHRFAFSKDSIHNERMVYEVSTPAGRMLVTQIAGAFARRCVSYVEPGSVVERGSRFGMIRLSSRVDLSLPALQGLEPAVAVGDRVLAGTSTLFVMPSAGG